MRGDKPYIKPTNAELKNRYSMVAEMLCQCLTKHQIYRLIQQQWDVHWRTADRYIVRAQEMLADECSGERKEIVAKAIGFYMSIIRKKGSSDRDKLSAMEGMRKLMGLDEPTRNELSGPGGKPLAITAKQEPPFDWGALEKEYAAKFGGLPAPDGNGKQIHSGDTAPAASLVLSQPVP